MNRLFLFESAAVRDPEVDAWFTARPGPLGTLSRHCFEILRAAGDDVRELLHDGHPTACLGTAAFAYVDAFSAHVNVGFFHGSDLDDPAGLLEGSGKFMRHVKLRPDSMPDQDALQQLIHEAYRDMRFRLAHWSG
jgi:hypothetical protein